MSLLALAATALSASAFLAPTADNRLSLAQGPTVFDYSAEIGALPPLNFFDPLGLSTDIDEYTFDQYRAAELKHGDMPLAWIIMLGGRKS